ncbi:protein SENSITIVITY TO RED LIGHT REDUCED 1-like [Neltuma alba]|uniref:protein SENSITIVITY TO RED LIGHT REDUCED 1-like n=1 Tax=Neltuma alba TaxID=207710 RepID=UPI0010A506BC|nr:protein SENSITIVITY TO RED LIGHT REDUCED 1-like [Prosopis alba]
MTTSTITGTPWHPEDEQVDCASVKALRREMKKCINELKKSPFYRDFQIQFQSSPISRRIQRLLGSKSKMQMVIYGIGSISECKSSQLQLSLAILMKKDFIWVGEIEVFDPILSKTEIKVLESLDCLVLYVNEEGRRQALEPTMFFMPHCDIGLFNNLLEANWKPNLLSNVFIFGNSLDGHLETLFYGWEDNTKRKFIWPVLGHVLAAETFTNEFKMRAITYGGSHRTGKVSHSKNKKRTGKDTSDFQEDCEHSFYGLAWHVFSPLTETVMGLMRWYVREVLFRL